jgi:hypothetical protein
MTVQANLPEGRENSPQLPTKLVYLGVIVGMILILVGIALMAVGRGSLLSSRASGLDWFSHHWVLTRRDLEPVGQ